MIFRSMRALSLCLLSFVTMAGCASSRSAGSVSTMPLSLASESTEASHVEAAHSLVLMTISEEAMATMTQISLDGVLRANPALAQLRPVFDEFFRQYLTREALAEKLAPLYAGRFTELELRQMAWFYETPVGRKALVELPGLMEAGGSAGQAIVTEHAADLERMIGEYVSAHPEAAPSAH